MFSKNRKNIEIKLIMPEISLIYFLFNTRFLNLFEVVLALVYQGGENSLVSSPQHTHLQYPDTRLDTQIVVERYFVLMLIYLYGMNQFLNYFIVLSVFLNSWSASAS